MAMPAVRAPIRCSTMSSTLVCSSRPKRASVCSTRRGSLVCTCTRRRASPPATTSDSPNPATAAVSAVAVDGALPDRDQRLRAEAEAIVDVVLASKRWRSTCPAGRRCGSWTLRRSPQELRDALEEVDEPLPPGVDDVTARQHLQLARRVGERFAGAGEPVQQQLLELGAVRRMLTQRAGPCAQDGEDGALPRIGEGGVGGFGAAMGGGGELGGSEGYGAADRRRQAVQELGDDGSRVATGAVQGGVRRHPRGGAHLLGRVVAQPGCGGTKRSCKVETGVGVAHREDVDAVERLLLARHCQRAGTHHLGKGAPGEPQEPSLGFAHGRAPSCLRRRCSIGPAPMVMTVPPSVRRERGRWPPAVPPCRPRTP